MQSIKAIRSVVSALVSVVGIAVLAPIATAAPAPRVGDLIGSHALPAGWGTSDRATSIEYWTEGPTGTPTPASGVMVLPAGSPPPGGWPVVSWDHGTSGFGPNCGITANKGKSDGPIMQRFADLGYAVVATDYVGLGPHPQSGHQYLGSRSEATATVDIVRAARQITPDLSRRWAVAGVSQGGHAALSTGNIASSYAPELDFHGTVALAPASNIEYVESLLGPYIPPIPDSDGTTVYLAAILAGLRVGQPDFDLDRYLTPLGRQFLDQISHLCQDQANALAQGRSIGSLLSRPLLDADFFDHIRRYTAIPATGFDQPIFIAHGYDDSTIPLPATLALLGEFDAAGTHYEFKTLQASHGEISEHAWPDVAAFITRVLPPR